jgi:hypothetical protein
MNKAFDARRYNKAECYAKCYQTNPLAFSRGQIPRVVMTGKQGNCRNEKHYQALSQFLVPAIGESTVTLVSRGH